MSHVLAVQLDKKHEIWSMATLLETVPQGMLVSTQIKGALCTWEGIPHVTPRLKPQVHIMFSTNLRTLLALLISTRPQ